MTTINETITIIINIETGAGSPKTPTENHELSRIKQKIQSLGIQTRFTIEQIKAEIAECETRRAQYSVRGADRSKLIQII